MKHFTICLTHIFILSFLFSCNKEQDQRNEVAAVTPEALQDEKTLEIKSSRSGNLVEELYQGLTEKDPVLKSMEEELEAFRLKPGEVTNMFYEYNQKSENFYTSGKHNTASIKDSLLKKKIFALIDNSTKRYSIKTVELNDLLKHIAANSSTIQDHHTILKIVLTLPLIEKYQDDHLPKTDTFKNVIRQQEKIIPKIDSLTPTY